VRHAAARAIAARRTCVRRARRRAGDLDLLLAKGKDQPGTVVVSAVSGMAGVGKTALAVYWGHEVRDQFPDDREGYANLRGFDPSGSVLDPSEALRRFLESLAVRPDRIPSDLAAQSALFRSLLADRRVLVLLDNARDSDQVRPLLPGASNAFVIVTSRNQLTVLSVQELADRAAIVDAVIAYATALDARDWETLGALFTDDACWEYSSVFRQVHNTFNGTDVEIR
jgi:uncharacterized small protein (DUF1192 family)